MTASLGSPGPPGPPSGAIPPRAALAVLAVAVLALYVRTLHPAYQIDDSPETVAACLNLGVQHPPGYPLFTLLGKIATVLPAGSAYYRVNLLAAALGAACVLLCAAVVHRLVPTPAGLAAGVLAGLTLAVSRLFWEGAISAKGGIYHLNLMVILLAVHLLAAGSGARRRETLLLGLVLGLGMANHWMSVVWWIPVALLVLRPWRDPRRFALALALGTLGGSLYLQMPLRAEAEPAWGYPDRWRDFHPLLTRQGFLRHAPLKPPSSSWLQFGWALLFPFREGGVAFAVLGLGGAVALWRTRRRAFTVLASGSLLTLAAVSVLANPVHIPTGESILWLTDRFFLPFAAATAVAAGAGIVLLRNALPRGARPAAWIAAAALPAWLLAGHLSRNDHSRDYLGFDYAENLRVGVNRPMSFLAEADYQAFPLLALLHVERREPEAKLIITNPFLNREWGWRRLVRKVPGARAIVLAHPGSFEERVAGLVRHLSAAESLYHLPLGSYASLNEMRASHGLVDEMKPGAKRADLDGGKDPDWYLSRFRTRGLVSARPFRDEAAFSVLDAYPLMLRPAAMRAARAGRLEEAIAHCRRGLVFPGRIGRALLLSALGRACGQLERYPEAERAFREAAGLKPKDLDLWTNLATALAAQGKYGEARRLFRHVLRRNPRHASAQSNLARMERMEEFNK